MREISELHAWDGARVPAPTVPAGATPEADSGQAILASWNLMLGGGSLQAFEPHLAGTARKPVAVLSDATAQAAGVRGGSLLTLSGPSGDLTLDAVIQPMPDCVVWVPQNSVGCSITALGINAGEPVALRATPAEVTK